MALSAIKGMRYAGNEYFWINDLEPKMIMHPINADLNGKSLSESKDPNGKRLFVEMANLARDKGEGVVDYMWAKEGSSKPVPKISYVKLEKDWGWIVGSGIYVDDVQAQLAQMKWKIVAGCFIGAALIFLLAYFVAHRIKRNLASAVRMAENIAAGDLSTTVTVETQDETGQLLNAMQKMSERIQALADDAKMLSAAAVEGKLDTRADAAQHQGDYRKIIAGVNETLDAVITDRKSVV